MRIQECMLKADATYLHPIVRKSPGREWVAARDAGDIPLALFALYEISGYLSFGAAQGFLADADNVLFGYFGLLLRSLKELLLEGADLTRELNAAQKDIYDPVKKWRGLKSDSSAPTRSQRAFRHLTITMSGCLDNLGELIALFYTGSIPRLQVGRADFSDVDAWLRNPLAPASIVIISPVEHHLQRLHRILQPVVCTDGAERGWLSLLQLYRNKSAHIGDPMFRVGLHDKDGRFHYFVPRRWPYILEKELSSHKFQQEVDKERLASYLEELLVHQDIVSYVHGLGLKIRRVIELGCEELRKAYQEFRTFPVNELALKQLKHNTHLSDFRHFTTDEK